MASLVNEAYLPATLTVPPMSDEQFAEFCAEHSDLLFEMTAEGELLVMPPTYSLTGMRSMHLGSQLLVWSLQDGRGAVTDSSSGFVLPNGARRSPDAAWTLKERILQQGSRKIQRFWHLCPDFVIELRSDSDRTRVIREKMHEWIANGAQLAWLIDPENRTVEIYRPGCEPEVLANPESITADAPVEGFTLRLSPVWDPLA